jgi:hypothetical protein
MSSLTNWSVGLIVFTLITSLFLVMLGGEFQSADAKADFSDFTPKNSTSIWDAGDLLDTFNKFSYSISGLPLWLNALLLIPSLILLIITIMWLRGVA